MDDIFGGEDFACLRGAIPEDAGQSSAEAMLADHANANPPRVLDLGCGAGDAIDLVARLMPDAAYHGVDIESSPEVDARVRSDDALKTYDGVNLPWPDRHFGLVYSRQVFEHVRHPDALMADVARVLEPGGLFIGSLSNLEPYHSYSIFNTTPWGLWRLLTENGFDLISIRPGPEVTSMVVRQVTRRRLERFPALYPLIDLAGRVKGWSPRQRAYLKLRFSGHIVFAARRRETPDA